MLLLACCKSLAPRTTKTVPRDEHARLMLPDDVVPIKYDLSLWADPKADHFSGTVGIDISLLSDRSDIFLHAQDLEVMSVTVEDAHDRYKARFVPVNDQGLARIDLDQVLARGQYRLEIAYRARFRNDLSGLYKVIDDNEVYLFTQMEPVSARKMLPCFDEPRFKTPFNVKVVSPKGHTVIANNPLKSSVSQNDDDLHIFDSTKPLPTYLLALAIGPFDVVEGGLDSHGTRDKKIPFRGIATKGKGKKLALAMTETRAILEHLEDYFGVPYPYPKLDVIAIPDFAAGAMENAGAITFREWYLLLDEKTASIAQRMGFYTVMAHELAHQWFGNSVTMAWWDDLWLNEAFATWLSYKIVDKIKPEYNSSQHLLERAYAAMEEDSLTSARKIREPINSHHDIHNAFDSITYSKGAAVLNMLENYLGASRFRDAVSFHIKRFENKTARSRDFFESLAKFSEPSLVNSAETFLTQTGVPKIKFSYSCEEKGLRIRVAQSRYLPMGSTTASNKWSIPICFSYDDSGILKKHCFTLDQPSAKFDIEAKTCPNIVMPNAQGQGYYRFSLNLEAWKDLLDAPAHALTEGDRLALADSLLAELYAGSLDFAFVAEGLHALISPTSVALTRPFVKLMTEADNFWVNAENRAYAHRYAERALKDIYQQLSTQRELSSDQISLKKELAAFFGHIVKDKEVRLDLSLLGSAFLREIQQGKSVNLKSSDDNFLSDAVAVAMQFENDTALASLAESLGRISDTVIRGHLLYGFAKSRVGKDAQQIRSLIFSDHLRRNEQLKLFYDHVADPGNQPHTWEFLKSNWPKIKTILSPQQIGNLPYVAEGLCDASSAEDVNKFFSPVIANFVGGPRNLALVTDQIKICRARKAHVTVLANLFFDTVKAEFVQHEKSLP